MTIEEWAKDFKSFVNELEMPRDDYNGVMEYIDDALALLKEQEAVEPKQVDLYGKDDWYGLVCVCPDCKAEWMSDKDETHFCPNCGGRVKWNE